ncbi:MAG: MBL fold metallo-hydrolase [Pseudobdellovibrionaceae bacterium]|nr:MBL fold metallo-hydrolase [Pseudobdellovibrionaceae bacterium]
MKVSFLGGATDIGASSALLEVCGKSFLVDCGVRFDPARPLPNLDELDGISLDAILVTHAHSDHTGGLPVVHASFPSVPIYMTPPTLDLVTILYRDALKIMSSEEREVEVPLYGEEHVAGMLDMVRTIPMEEPLNFGAVTISWLPASHILGAAMIHISSPEGSVLFTGDYSVSPQLSVPGLRRPQIHVDMLITETTYGNRLHADREAGERKLIQRIADVMERKGRVLIPAFAIGRAQEVLLLLKRAMQQRLIPEVPVFVDGMVRAVCGVYSKHERYVSRHLRHEIRTAGHPFFNDLIRPVESAKDREGILDTSPCIIVSSSGMLNGGPSAFYARHLLRNKNDAIFITGYQDEESPGRALLNLAGKKTDRFIKIGGEQIAVEAEFDTYSLSAHADRLQMAGLVSALSPKTLVLVHGDAEAKSGLMQSVGSLDIVAADNGSIVVRTYEKTKPLIRSRVPAVSQEDAARLIQSLQQHKTIEEARLVEGLTGTVLAGDSLASVTRRLIDWGLVTRDDERPNLLHIETPEVESAEEKRLRKENPKGRLLEACMQAGVSMPKFATLKKGLEYHCTVSVSVMGQVFESDGVKAFDDKLSEQMAADSLLGSLDTHFQKTGQLVDVRALEASIGNAKGRYLERGTSPAMDFSFLPLRSGIAASATVQGRRTPFFIAGSKKNAEQAVYHHLLAELSTGPRHDSTPSPMDNPKGRLNEMKQQRLIDDFGFECIVSGPAHEPMFSGHGWARKDDRIIKSVVMEASSKKAFEQMAARELHRSIS